MATPTPADEDASRRRVAAMASLRAMSSGEFIARSTAEALAAAVVISPPFLLFYFLDGCFTAKYPRVAVNQQMPAIPQTFAGLLGSGLRYSLGCGARTVIWVTGSHAIGTALREQFKTGWRFEDSPKDNPMFFFTGFAAHHGFKFSH